MSAALQLPFLWAAASAQPMWTGRKRPVQNLVRNESFYPQEMEADLELDYDYDAANGADDDTDENRPHISLAFYRKHAENMLRRYLYASMVVGRTPSVMDDPVRGGRATCQRMRTFEDAVIFVLDMERCLAKLSHLDRALLTRIVLQEYTHTEASMMLGMSLRCVLYRFHKALDKVTELLLDAGLLDLPQH